MKKSRLIFTYLFAFVLIAAGINHVINPDVYAALIPKWLPLKATNNFTAVIEITLGGGLIFVGTRSWAAIGTTLLMIFFLPFHIYDVFREHPAVGSTLLALIRLPLQFVLIYGALFVIPKAR